MWHFTAFPGVEEFFPLVSFLKGVKSHLKQIKVSQNCVRTEKELILARAGKFCEDGMDRTICPRHRAELGLLWRPGRKCLHPLHGTRQKGKPDRGANLGMSKEIMQNWDVLIPVGTGKS